MSKKLKIMSISIAPELEEALKEAKKKSGNSVSQLVSDLVEKYLKLVVNDGEEIPVVLKIPTKYKGQAELLRNWIDIKKEAIVNALAPANSN